MLPLEGETAVQAVVGSIVWAIRRLKKPRCREMSARGNAFHSVCPQLSFLSVINRELLQSGPVIIDFRGPDKRFISDS